MSFGNYKQKPFIQDQSQLCSSIISRVIGQERSIYGPIMGEVKPNFDLVAKKRLKRACIETKWEKSYEFRQLQTETFHSRPISAL